MTNRSEVRIQLYRDDREGGEGFEFPENDHRYGADIDLLIDELAGGADKLDRKAEPPSRDIAQGARIELHEIGPDIVALIGAAASLIGAVTPLLVAWIQKPTREIVIYHRDKEVARGNLTPDQVRRTLEKLGGQE